MACPNKPSSAKGTPPPAGVDEYDPDEVRFLTEKRILPPPFPFVQCLRRPVYGKTFALSTFFFLLLKTKISKKIKIAG